MGGSLGRTRMRECSSRAYAVRMEETTGEATRLRTGGNLNRDAGPPVQARVVTHRRDAKTRANHSWTNLYRTLLELTVCKESDGRDAAKRRLWLETQTLATLGLQSVETACFAGRRSLSSAAMS